MVEVIVKGVRKVMRKRYAAILVKAGMAEYPKPKAPKKRSKRKKEE